nr:PASTA domain-containing protein [Kitasatospora viridis]
MRAALEEALLLPPATTVSRPAPPDAPAPPRRRRRTGRLGVAITACLALAAGATAYAVAHRSGTPASSQRIPELAGVTVLQARESVRNAGLRMGDIAYGDCPGPRAAQPSRICAQHPAPGTLVARGTAVTVRLPDPHRATAQ